jgi:hypothetical protein
METFKFSTDPELEANLRDVVGLCLDPPAGAVVVGVDDQKSQIQARDCTQPILPLRLGIPEQQTHDYIRDQSKSPNRRASAAEPESPCYSAGCDDSQGQHRWNGGKPASRPTPPVALLFTRLG